MVRKKKVKRRIRTDLKKRLGRMLVQRIKKQKKRPKKIGKVMK